MRATAPEERSAPGDDDAPAGQHEPGLEHGLRPGRADHAGQRPAGEGQLALDGPGREDEAAGAQGDAAAAVGPGERVQDAVLAGPRRRPDLVAGEVAQAPGVAVPGEAGGECGEGGPAVVQGLGAGGAEAGGGCAVVLATGGVGRVDEQHVESGVGGGDGCGEPGGPRAHHGDVRVVRRHVRSPPGS